MLTTYRILLDLVNFSKTSLLTHGYRNNGYQSLKRLISMFNKAALKFLSQMVFGGLAKMLSLEEPE